MKIAVASQNPDLDNLAYTHFGRIAGFFIHDSSDAVVSGTIAPKALEVHQVVDMQVVVCGSGEVAKAIEPVRGGRRQRQDAPTHAGHAVEQGTRGRRIGV